MLLLTAEASAQDWLDSHRWQQRLVLATGPLSEAQSKKLSLQLRQHEAALRARRMAVWRVEPTGLQWLGGTDALDIKATSDLDLAAVHRELAPSSRRHGLHLIGLDGGLKASRAGFTRLEELIAEVDSMQMRLRELGD